MKTKTYRHIWLSFDRALAHNLLRQLAILGCVLALALGLSYLFLFISNAEWQKFCDEEKINKFLLPIYLLIDSNALNNLYMGSDGTHVHGWMLFASSITFLFGAFIFYGFIIGIITNSLELRVKNYLEGRIHYLKSGHYIIMGYDDMVPSIITHVFEKDKSAFVLLLTSAKVVEVKEDIEKSFSEKDIERIIVNYGHRVSTNSFNDIHLEFAEEIFVVGNHTKSAHDAINVECVDSICRYLNNSKIKQRPKRITCVFKDLDTYAAFKTSEIFQEVRKLNIEFIPYNFYAGWAKQIFVKRKYKDFDNPGKEYEYPTVYGKGITPDDEKYVHLVFVGTTNFAVASAMEAANVLHFPNSDKAKTLITFIDKNADKEKEEFITRNRHFFEIQAYTYRDFSEETNKEKDGKRQEYLKFSDEDSNFLDVEFEFIKGDIFSKKVQDEISVWAKEHNKKQYLSLFLALADQRQNFVMGINMPDDVYDNEVPLFIRQDRSDNFVTNLRNADKRGEENKMNYSTVKKDGTLNQIKREARFANIYPFGMNETAFCADEHSLKRAKLINFLYHTANYETCKFLSAFVLNTMSEEKVWQEANSYWQHLTVALKWSNLYNAYTIRTKLTTLRAMRGLDVNDTSLDTQVLSDYELEMMSKTEHNRWNVEKLLMGYRKAHAEEDKYKSSKYANDLVKNKNLFIHHDIRPYEQLDITKELDIEFTRYIPWIIKMTEK